MSPPSSRSPASLPLDVLLGWCIPGAGHLSRGYRRQGAVVLGVVASFFVLGLVLSDFEAVPDGFDPATADPNYRLWEVAGTGHSDFFIGHQSVFGHGPRVLAGLPKQDAQQYTATLTAAGNYGERVDPELLACVVAGSTMPMRYAASSALHQLDRWVGGGAAPDNGPRFAFGVPITHRPHREVERADAHAPVDLAVVPHPDPDDGTDRDRAGDDLHFPDVENRRRA